MPGISPETFFEVFNGAKPAGKFYVDCSNARGGDAVALQLAQALEHKSQFQHILFTGHLGCGKSSELEHLRSCLIRQANKVSGGMLPVLVDCDPYLDTRDVDLRDVLMTIVVELGAAFGELGIELKDSYFQKRLTELRDLFRSEVSLDKIELTSGAAKSIWSLNQLYGSFRKEVREKLSEQTETLVTALNELILKARAAIRAHGKYQDFCFIVDGLEKMEKLSEKEAGEKTHVAFFVDAAYQLKSIEAHTVWTIPLAFARRFGPELAQKYGDEPFVLPMIKTRLKDGSQDAEGCDDLKKIAQKRLGENPLIEVVSDEAIALAVRYSGGHVRQFIRLIESAGEYSSVKFPIETTAMTKAIGRLARTFQDTLADKDYKLLAELESSTDRTWEHNDPEKRRLLDQLCVLEYVNGEIANSAQAGFLDRAGLKWYAVHPIVKELPAFKTAASALPG